MPPPSLYWLLTVAKTEVLRRAGVLSPHPTALFRVSAPAFPPSGQLEPSDQDRPGPQTATPAPGCAPDVTEATSRCTGRPSPPHRPYSPRSGVSVSSSRSTSPPGRTCARHSRRPRPPDSPATQHATSPSLPSLPVRTPAPRRPALGRQAPPRPRLRRRRLLEPSLREAPRPADGPSPVLTCAVTARLDPAPRPVPPLAGRRAGRGSRP